MCEAELPYTSYAIASSQYGISSAAELANNISVLTANLASTGIT
jgi:hypothetical protein